MPNARHKKKVSGRTAQATGTRRRQKGRKQIRAAPARARTEFIRGMSHAAENESGSNRNADAQLTTPRGERFKDTYATWREGAQHATGQPGGNLAQVFQSGAIVASATRSILQELVNFTQERIHQNFTRLLALAYCRTPPQLIAAQRDFVRDNVEGLVRSTGRITDVSMLMAREGLRRMSAVSLLQR
jgi:hypothetical protein